MVRCLFFDFFGTLVRYDREIRAARISQAAGFVRGLGCTASEAELAYELAAVWRELSRASARCCSGFVSRRPSSRTPTTRRWFLASYGASGSPIHSSS